MQTLILFSSKFYVNIEWILIVFLTCYRKGSCKTSEYGIEICWRKQILWNLTKFIFGNFSLLWWICNTIISSGNERRFLSFIIFLVNVLLLLIFLFPILSPFHYYLYSYLYNYFFLFLFFSFSSQLFLILFISTSFLSFFFYSCLIFFSLISFLLFLFFFLLFFIIPFFTSFFSFLLFIIFFSYFLILCTFRLLIWNFIWFEKGYFSLLFCFLPNPIFCSYATHSSRFKF